MKYKIYCDMDGVLVDFNKGYQKLTGVDISGNFSNSPSFWNPINKAGHKFWVNLEWMSDGKELWEYIKEYKPQILSAPSREIDSRVGKNDWVKRELPGVKLLLRTAKYKHEFASPKSILIDDREENVDKWVEAGGLGIVHTSTKKTISELKKIGL